MPRHYSSKIRWANKNFVSSFPKGCNYTLVHPVQAEKRAPIRIWSSVKRYVQQVLTPSASHWPWMERISRAKMSAASEKVKSAPAQQRSQISKWSHLLSCEATERKEKKANEQDEMKKHFARHIYKKRAETHTFCLFKVQ